MHKDRPCKRCGGLDEFVYEINRRAIYYCDTCRVETIASGSDMVGPAERLIEETGE